MKGRAAGYVYTGRLVERARCPSCKLRYKIGEPAAADTWPAKLSLTQHQIDLLLVAAAEFRQISLECATCNHDRHDQHDVCREDDCRCGEYVMKLPLPDAVAFLDWMAPDALTASYVSPVNVSTLERGTYSEKRR